MPRIIGRLVKFIDDQQGVFLRMVNEVPELRHTATQMSIERLAYQVTTAWVRQHMPHLSNGALRYKMFLAQHASMALVYGYITDKPAGVSRSRFVADLSRLLIGLLRDPHQ